MKTLSRTHLRDYSPDLLQALLEVRARSGQSLYFSGGSVRDWIRGRGPGTDLDITVTGDAFTAARLFATLTGDTFVPLDALHGVARSAGKDTVDFTAFRGGARTIVEDLRLRDFSINAMAVALPDFLDGDAPLPLIDPSAGAADCDHRVIRAITDQVFTDDPLRLIRAYRFQAVLGFTIAPTTAELIRRHAHLASRPAAERLAHELELIMASPRATQAVAAMADDGVLHELFPELSAGMGVIQPESHHLDVFAHNLAALAAMERILLDPGAFYPAQADLLTTCLQSEKRRIQLKWAALLHDLGKPATRLIKEGRIRFYGHETAGAAVFDTIATRYRWSKEDSKAVALLIKAHMRPFHLSAIPARGKKVTIRACLKLWKDVGESLPDLFLLAMADSLASEGREKPKDMETRLAKLYDEVDRLLRERIAPVVAAPRLLTGHDLETQFGLAPGPLYRELLDGLQYARIAGQVTCRKEAMRWVRHFLDSHCDREEIPSK